MLKARGSGGVLPPLLGTMWLMFGLQMLARGPQPARGAVEAAALRAVGHGVQKRVERNPEPHLPCFLVPVPEQHFPLL